MIPRALIPVLLTLAACQSPSETSLSEKTSDPGTFQIVHLSHAEARELANTVEDAFGRSKTFQIVPDARTNAVILSGTPQELEKAKTLIRELDIATPKKGS